MSTPQGRGGRALKGKGTRTREQILAAVATHLASTPWHRASVPALIRDADADVTASTFYQYFPDLPAAVRELASDVSRPVPEHVRRVAALLAWEDENIGYLQMGG